MTKEIKTIETYLPVFPGFYGTIFDADEDYELEQVNNEREDKGLKPVLFDELKFDYEKHKIKIAKLCCEAIEEKLRDVPVEFVTITFQEIISPKYYNYSNDSINIEVKYNEDELMSYVNSEFEAFKRHIKDNYSSRDGFTPSYPNNATEWLKEAKNEHKIGALLGFILENEEYAYEELYYDISENEGVDIECENYNELIDGKFTVAE